MEYDQRNALRKTISSSWIFTFSYLMYYFLELVCFEGVHLPMWLYLFPNPVYTTKLVTLPIVGLLLF